MFGFFKLILVAIIGIVVVGIIFISSIFNGNSVSKDGILNTFNSFLQDTSINGLTKNNKLEGEREFGIDEYVGTYKANYNKKTKEETIFGGTVLNRENGNTILLKIKVEKQSGSIEIINNSGTESEVLINDTGEVEKSIDVKEKSYYLKIKVTDFTGNVEIVAE